MTHRSPTITGDELDDQSWSLLNKSVFRFEDAWNGGVRPDIGAFLPSLNGILRERVLVELVKVDQENCWRGGLQRLLEAYVSDWPELGTREDTLVELLSAECLTRSIFDKPPSFRELRSRFPVLCERVPLARLREEADCERTRAVELAGSSAAPSAWWPADASHSRLIGAIPEHYDIRGLLHQRSNGVVYKAYDRQRAREVAIGVCYCDPAAEPLASGLFLREARLKAAERSPAKQVIYDFGKVSDICYLVVPLDNVKRRSRGQALIPPGRARGPSMSLLQEEQVIRGTYEVERLLGEGAFAEVYRVKHRFLGRQAMKA
ncbi:MAG: hypothetical protein ABSG68_11680 [Thermoguttaceae bacterium]|jgi:hypothetical protein